MTPPTHRMCLTMRRLPLVIVLLGALAGCSSGSNDTAGSAASGGDTAKFCAAVTRLEAAKGSDDVAAAGVAFGSAAADLHAYAPAQIKAATDTYAAMIDDLGKAARSGSLDQQTLQTQLSTGMAVKGDEIAKVAIWVSKNCPR
jgi:hypothetical protein